MHKSQRYDAGLPALDAMLDELRGAPDVYKSSRFWEHHAELQRRELAEHGGFEAFKRTVNCHFFQFIITSVRDPQFRAVARRWLRRPSPLALLARLNARLPDQPVRLARLRALFGSRVYAIYIAMLARHAAHQDRSGVFASLSEPSLGEPVGVRYKRRLVSEDMCNSALEYNSILDGLPAPPRSVIELGAGYGRLAWVFLRAQPDVRYVVVDIPPGLAIAQRYLTELFPDTPAFRFRHFDDFSEVADEFQSAQIAFLTPNQLELVPSLHADLFVNVSSLHEMSHEQIERYFQLIGQHCDGFFYTKQWQRSVNPFDQLVVSRDDYPVRPTWEALFDRAAPVQTYFFEALYAVGPRVHDTRGQLQPAANASRRRRPAGHQSRGQQGEPARAR